MPGLKGVDEKLFFKLFLFGPVCHNINFVGVSTEGAIRPFMRGTEFLAASSLSLDTAASEDKGLLNETETDRYKTDVSGSHTQHSYVLIFPVNNGNR